MKVVLFDIDGTILSTNGAGRRAVTQAIRETFDRGTSNDHEFDGKTDPQIIRELMQLEGVSDTIIAERMDAVLSRYVELLGHEMRATGFASTTYPGVFELIAALEREESVTLGLLTGNVESGARAKIESVGLDFSKFRVGAFGSDHGSRPELPGIAQRRAAELLGRAVPGADMFIIGDTPADMQCGNGIGARAIGVATGRYSVSDLEKCQPAAVFADLSDTDAVLDVIFGRSRSDVIATGTK